MWVFRFSYNPAVLQKLEGSTKLLAGLAHALEKAVHDGADPLARKLVGNGEEFRLKIQLCWKLFYQFPFLQLYFFCEIWDQIPLWIKANATFNYQCNA